MRHPDKYLGAPGQPSGQVDDHESGSLSKDGAGQAARLLGTTRRILKYKMDQLGLKKEGLAEEA